jgi:5-formyltetrahydrofolate cyclo-ligase
MTGGQIRNQLRVKRRSLTPRQQRQSADKLASILGTQSFFLRAKRVAVYVSNDGEIDPSVIINICLQCGKQCFLPVLHPLGINRLYFARYHRQTQLVENRYGIAEPSLKQATLAPAWSLDIILVPLVGFDRRGNRMGMGGGYYDRTLAFVTAGNSPAPTLVGLAHSCQEISSISTQNWDIPLNNIITDREIICVTQK